jgi:N-acetylglutamate synthase-like GNAT family acetyltransferase
MIRKCNGEDFRRIYEIINNAAQVYRGIIPAGHWKNPYMSQDELKQEIDSGIAFWGYQEEGRLQGIMGIQPLQDVTLIRHAYVLTEKQRCGMGGELLTHLRSLTAAPILIGTWADAFWAIGFYQKHGFALVPKEDTMRLLGRYWTAPAWHMEMSVVLADEKWFSLYQARG